MTIEFCVRVLINVNYLNLFCIPKNINILHNIFYNNFGQQDIKFGLYYCVQDF